MNRKKKTVDLKQSYLAKFRLDVWSKMLTCSEALNCFKKQTLPACNLDSVSSADKHLQFRQITCCASYFNSFLGVYINTDVTLSLFWFTTYYIKSSHNSATCVYCVNRFSFWETFFEWSKSPVQKWNIHFQGKKKKHCQFLFLPGPSFMWKSTQLDFFNFVQESRSIFF